MLTHLPEEPSVINCQYAVEKVNTVQVDFKLTFSIPKSVEKTTQSINTIY